jgi:hypothetical protein
MAKATAGRPSGATWIWAGLAVLAVAVFLMWLAMTSEPSVIATVQEDTTEAAGGGAIASGQVVTAAAFESGAQGYIGQDIQLEGVTVTSKMGPEVLWIELPSGAPYLVKTDAATSSSLPAQAVVTIVGRVVAKSDSVLNAWEQSGAIQNAGHRAQAEYGTSFIEARAIRPAGD